MGHHLFHKKMDHLGLIPKHIMEDRISKGVDGKCIPFLFLVSVTTSAPRQPVHPIHSSFFPCSTKEKKKNTAIILFLSHTLKSESK
jgi:hypothetical protein